MPALQFTLINRTLNFLQQGRFMLPDLAKIIAADQAGQETVTQAQQEALALKRQAEARVRESQAQLQDDLARVRQKAQTEILAAAEARAAEIAAATARQVQGLSDQGTARQAEAVAALVSRVLGT